MNQPKVLRTAVFTEKAVLYHTLSATIPFAIIFLVLGLVIGVLTFGLGLLLWFVPFGVFLLLKWYYTIYFRKLECELTERKLHVGKGVLFRTEKAIPLDKITDMSMKQGPLLRYLDLEAMGVETAGQSSSPGGNLVSLVGIEGSREFRAAVLEQRDRVAGNSVASSDVGPVAHATGTADAAAPVLHEIRDTLLRIEQRLSDRDVGA
jgi:putative membrane protein